MFVAGRRLDLTTVKMPDVAIRLLSSDPQIAQKSRGYLPCERNRIVTTMRSSHDVIPTSFVPSRFVADDVVRDVTKALF